MEFSFAALILAGCAEAGEEQIKPKIKAKPEIKSVFDDGGRIPENIPNSPEIEKSIKGMQGRNSFGRIEYSGP